MALSGERQRAAATALTLVLASVGSAYAAGGLRETYNFALSAVEAERWSEAERHLRAAIALRTTEARRLTFKGILRPYMPHFYLGVALGRQGDCRGALRELRTSEEQGAIVGHELHDYLKNSRTTCEERLRQLEQAVGRTAAALDAATATADQLAAPERAAVLGLGVEGASGSLGQRLARARQTISETRAELEKADAEERTEDASRLTESAQAVGTDLDAALARADEIRVELEEQRAEKRDRVASVRDLAREVGSLLRSRSPLPPSLRGRRQQLESLLAGASALPEAATLTQIDGLERRLLVFQRQLQSSTPPPPGALRSGAIAFLRADYPAVLERLEQIPYRDAKSRAHSHLLRAAASYALWVAGGESDPALLENARTDVLGAYESQPDLAPTEAAFSPRFVRFFEDSASETPEAESGEESAG